MYHSFNLLYQNFSCIIGSIFYIKILAAYTIIFMSFLKFLLAFREKWLASLYT